MKIDVSNTPDGYTIDVLGSFTFNTKCGVRTSPDVNVTSVAYYDVGQTVHYARKVKYVNHLWVFPTYVGVILKLVVDTTLMHRIPHVCGGDPTD